MCIWSIWTYLYLRMSRTCGPSMIYGPSKSFLTLVGFSHSLCIGRKLEKTKKNGPKWFFHYKTHFSTPKLIFSTAKKLIFPRQNSFFPLQNSFFHYKTHFSTAKKPKKVIHLQFKSPPILHFEYCTGHLDLPHKNWMCSKLKIMMTLKKKSKKKRKKKIKTSGLFFGGQLVHVTDR